MVHETAQGGEPVVLIHVNPHVFGEKLEQSGLGQEHRLIKILHGEFLQFGQNCLIGDSAVFWKDRWIAELFNQVFPVLVK